MSEPLVVHLNRGALHEVVPASDDYRADGDFAVALRNHGRAVHAHLKLEGPLSHVASLGEPNHFVDTDATKTVRVEVEDGTAPIEGWLEVVTGYGSERDRVAVTLDGREGGGRSAEQPAPGPVTVEERLGDRPDDGLADAEPAQVAVFAAVAALLAAGAVWLAPSLAVGLGVAVVAVGTLAAVYVLAT